VKKAEEEKELVYQPNVLLGCKVAALN